MRPARLRGGTRSKHVEPYNAICCILVIDVKSKTKKDSVVPRATESTRRLAVYCSIYLLHSQLVLFLY
jgi:hypothetical protein